MQFSDQSLAKFLACVSGQEENEVEHLFKKSTRWRQLTTRALRQSAVQREGTEKEEEKEEQEKEAKAAAATEAAATTNASGQGQARVQRERERESERERQCREASKQANSEGVKLLHPSPSERKREHFLCLVWGGELSVVERVRLCSPQPATCCRSLL